MAWIDVESLLPGLAAIRRHENAAIRMRPEGVSERADEDNIGIAGMNVDAGDTFRSR